MAVIKSNNLRALICLLPDSTPVDRRNVCTEYHTAAIKRCTCNNSSKQLGAIVHNATWSLCYLISLLPSDPSHPETVKVETLSTSFVFLPQVHLITLAT